MHVDMEKPQNHSRFGAKVLKFDTCMHVNIKKPQNHINSGASVQKFSNTCMYVDIEEPQNYSDIRIKLKGK